MLCFGGFVGLGWVGLGFTGTSSCYIALASWNLLGITRLCELALILFLPLPSEYWDSGAGPLHLASAFEYWGYGLYHYI